MEKKQAVKASRKGEKGSIKKALVWHVESLGFKFEKKEDKNSWSKNGRKLSFVFEPQNADDAGQTIFAHPENATQYFELNPRNSTVEITEGKDKVVVTASVNVEAELKKDVDEEKFSEWATDQGGWSSGTIEPAGIEGDFSFTEDAGGSLNGHNPLSAALTAVRK